jgi:putative methyltransferase
LRDVIAAADLLRQERKIKSLNLALVLVHDLLLTSGGIQAGDGPIKQAVLRHKTRLRGELQRVKIKRGVSSNTDLARLGDEKAGEVVVLWLARL